MSVDEKALAIVQGNASDFVKDWGRRIIEAYESAKTQHPDERGVDEIQIVTIHHIGGCGLFNCNCPRTRHVERITPPESEGA